MTNLDTAGREELALLGQMLTEQFHHGHPNQMWDESGLREAMEHAVEMMHATDVDTYEQELKTVKRIVNAMYDDRYPY
jgi:hypothetical protein